MAARSGTLPFVVFLFVSPAFTGDDVNLTVPLLVPQGAPLRLYLTRKVSKRAGAPIDARLLEPLFAFDHEVVPAGAAVEGRVKRVQPVARLQRIRAVMGGDFTPLRRAQLEFTSIVMPDGRSLPVHTVETTGLNT